MQNPVSRDGQTPPRRRYAAPSHARPQPLSPNSHPRGRGTGLKRANCIAVMIAASVVVTGCGAVSHVRSTRTVNPAETVIFRPIDGGPNYFASLSPRSAWMDRHILLGAWDEQPQTLQDVENDAAMGDNIYWNLAGQPRVTYAAIRTGGMRVSAPDTDRTSGSETVEYHGTDEADMNFGPGANGWNSNSTCSGGGAYRQCACEPANSQCGYTVSNFIATGNTANVTPSTATTDYPTGAGQLPVDQGFGKGVLFWESDQQAAKFLRYSDISSADSYWMTDPDLSVPSQGGCALLPNRPTACTNSNASGLTNAQRELPANYAYNVYELERLQRLNGSFKPVAVDVETGCPFSGGQPLCATPPETIAAAWHALIAGARGIIWFQHNFAGSCQDDRTFADGWNPSSSKYNCQQTPGVTIHDLVVDIKAFNQEVNSLNDVLLSDSAQGYVSVNGDVSTLPKAYGGDCYVFAGSGQPATPPPANQRVTFTLADGYSGPVTVYDENRTLQATNGAFSDKFADANSVHIYRIPGGTICSHVGNGAAPVVGSGPHLAHLSLRPRSFRAALRDRSIARTRYGTTISYTDSSAAVTTFTVYRALTGVRRGARCVVRPQRNARRRAKKCMRFVALRSTFRRTDHVGWNRFHFTSRVGGRRLAAGRYRLVARPRLGGRPGPPHSSDFRIARR